MNIIFIKKYSFLFTFVLFLLVLFTKGADAQKSPHGEIINVNFKYKIAYTDFSDSYLNKGDIVEIQKDLGPLTYLYVSETSSIMSKLIPIPKVLNSFYKSDFDKVSIGCEVIRVQKSVTSAPQRPLLFQEEQPPDQTKQDQFDETARDQKFNLNEVQANSEDTDVTRSNTAAKVTESSKNESVAAGSPGADEGTIREMLEANIKLSNQLSQQLKEQDTLKRALILKEEELQKTIKRLKELEDLNASQNKDIEQKKSFIQDLSKSLITQKNLNASLEDDILKLREKLTNLSEYLKKALEPNEKE